jgi:hypothetical protein
LLQPSGVNGGALGLYAAAKGSNGLANSNLWAANFLVQADVGATGGVFGVEIDLNSYASGANYIGLDITGIGSVNPQLGIAIQRADTTIWGVGLNINNSNVGINIAGTGLSRGIVINTPPAIANSLFSAKAIANNDTMTFLQRFTDTAPTGYFQSFVNAANNAVLYSVDVLGNVAANTLAAKGAASATFAGAIAFGSSTATSALTGGASALPAAPVGYLIAYLASVPIKIPFYNN